MSENDVTSTDGKDPPNPSPHSKEKTNFKKPPGTQKSPPILKNLKKTKKKKKKKEKKKKLVKPEKKKKKKSKSI